MVNITVNPERMMIDARSMDIDLQASFLKVETP